MGRNSGGVRTQKSKRSETSAMRREVLARARKRYEESRWWASPPSWSGVMKEQWGIVITNARMKRQAEEYANIRKEKERRAIAAARKAWAKMSPAEQQSYSMGYWQGRYMGD